MEDIKVSIYCLAYNCADFFEKSIQGMLNQRVNFQYKIIVHDDASTDGTADLIRKYAEQYPDKICSILQTENQYSKGVDICKVYIEPKLEGKYVAICEGDDYWIDENKLQVQYDYMETHPECSLCTHNTEICDLSTGRKRRFNNWKDIHILTEEEIFLQWSVHTSSYFVRRENEKWTGNYYMFGDYVMLTWAFYKGEVVCLSQMMSVYNFNNPNGLTKMNYNAGLMKKQKIERDRISYLNEFNEKTQYRYNSVIAKRCKIMDYGCLERECDYIILHSDSKEDVIKAAKKLTSHEYYSESLHAKKGIRRLIKKYRYEGYRFYPLWKIVMKVYLTNRL